MTDIERLYKPFDEYLKRLKKKIKEKFAVLYVSGFDELNIIQLGTVSENVYKQLDEFNRKEYAELVKHAREWAESILGKKLSATDLDDFVRKYLNGYDPVTQYVYNKEIDRKRMRMNESILTAREYQDIQKMQKAVKKAADLWFTHSSQYGLDLMEAEVKQAYEDDDTKYFQWITVIDGHECDICRSRNMKIYPEELYPSKPHYNCRCIPKPVNGVKGDKPDSWQD